MTITDAGPLIALLCRNDQHHVSCTEALRSVAYPPTSTWSVSSETLHMLGSYLGRRGQDQLSHFLQQGHVVLRNLNDATHHSRMLDLMKG